MSTQLPSANRRRVLAGSAAVAASSLIPVQARAEGTAGGGAIRPFRAEVPEDQLADLRRRLAATRWPDRETVNDETQGVPLAMLQELARYWAKDYDWRKCEAKLNALPQFITQIDGLDIHFIHVRSKHDNALPLIVTHGWPEIYQAPRSWAEQAYHKLIYFHEVDKGGHFAAWEQPQLFSQEVRAGLRSLRT